MHSPAAFAAIRPGKYTVVGDNPDMHDAFVCNHCPPTDMHVQAQSPTAVTWSDLPAEVTEAGRTVLRDAQITAAVAKRLADELGYTSPEDLEVCQCNGCIDQPYKIPCT